MAVVRKAQSAATVTRKTSTTKLSVTSTRSPSQIEEMGDTNFGILDQSKDGYVVSYDSVTDKFISPDQVLAASSEDADLPDEFTSQLETELDLGTIQLDSLDGGSF
jgi:hypothetical protein